MKTIVSAIGLSLLTTSVLGFDIDITNEELARFRQAFIVGDLEVGSTGRVVEPCVEAGKLVVYESAGLYPFGNFILTMKPNKHVSLVYDPVVSWNGEKEAALMAYKRPPTFLRCDRAMEDLPLGELYEIDDIDGFTSYKEWSLYLIEKFPLAE